MYYHISQIYSIKSVRNKGENENAHNPIRHIDHLPHVTYIIS